MWSQTADNLKAESSRLRVLRLVLIVAAAMLALAGGQAKAVSSTGSVVLTSAAAVALAAVGALRGGMRTEQVRRWTRARSVSEALKSELFLFLSGSGAYGVADPEFRLEAEVHRLERDAGNLQRYADDVRPVTRELPAVHDIDSYLDIRVRRSQLEGYYEPKSRRTRQRLRVWKIAEVTLVLLAGVLAALAVVSSTVSAWAAVVTTAAGAVAAYAAAERYEFLWVEYSRTASELRRLLYRRTASDGRPLSNAELAAACEQVISVQNQAWMAKWGEEEPVAAVD